MMNEIGAVQQETAGHRRQSKKLTYLAWSPILSASLPTSKYRPEQGVSQGQTETGT